MSLNSSAKNDKKVPRDQKKVTKLEDTEAFSHFKEWQRRMKHRQEQKKRRQMVSSSSSSSDSTFGEDEIEDSSSSSDSTTEEEEVLVKIDPGEWRLLVSAVEDAVKEYDTTRPIILQVIDVTAFPEDQQKIAFRPSCQVIGLQLLEYMARRRGSAQHAALVRACQRPMLPESKALFVQLFDTESPGEFARVVTSYFEPVVIEAGMIMRTLRRDELAVQLFHFECENRYFS